MKKIILLLNPTFVIFILTFIISSDVSAAFEDSTITHVCQNDEDGYIYDSEIKYIYAASGLLKRVNEYTIENNIHVLTGFSVYEYDSAGHLLLHADSSKSIGFPYSRSYAYTYDSSGNVLTYEFIYIFNGTINQHDYIEYTNDLNGFVSSVTKQSGNPLMYTTRNDYERNAAGKDTVNILYSWDGAGWVPERRTLTTYQLNDTVKTAGYFQDPDGFQGWITTTFDTLLYDTAGFLWQDITFEIDTGIPDSLERIIFTYNSYVPLSYHRSEEYYYGFGWSSEFWQDYDYDLNGNLISAHSDCVGCGGSSSLYYYNAQNLLYHYIKSSSTMGGILTSRDCQVYYYDIHGSFNICQTDTITLTADSNFVSYLWSTGETTQSISVWLGGTYTVTLTDANGIVWQAAPHIIGLIAPPVAPYATDSIMNICRNGSAFRLEAEEIPGYTYEWLLNDTGLTDYYANQHNPSYFILPQNAPSGIYRLRVGNECGFDTSSSTIINFSPDSIPFITPSSPVTICLGDTLTLTATGGSHFAWIPTLDTTSSINVTYPGLYKVQVYDVQGCYSLLSCSVNVINPLAYIRQIADSTLSFSIPGYGSVSYRAWLLNGDTIPGEHSSTLHVYQDGIYSLIITSPQGCIDTLPPYNFIFGGIHLYAGNDQRVCSGINGTIGNSSTVTNGIPPYNYAWTQDGVTIFSGTQSSNNFQKSLILNSSITDTIEFILTVLDSSGASAADTQYVIVQAPPSVIPSITGASLDSVCNGAISLLTASPPGNYYWTRAGGSTVPSTNYFTTAIAGTYTCKFIDLYGCQSSPSNPYILYNYPVPAQPSITITGTSPACWGDSIMLSAPYDSSLTYKWTGPSINDVYPSDSNIFYATSTNTYYLRVTNPYGCYATGGGAHVEFDTLFEFPITVYMPTVVCSGDSVQMVSPSFAGYTYQWTKDGLPISGATDTVYYAKETGYYLLQITDSTGCSAGSEEWHIQVRPYNMLTVTQTDSLLLAQALFTSTFQWYNDTTLLTGEDSALFVAHQTGNYYVVATDYHGCQARSGIFDFNCMMTLSENPINCFGICDGSILSSSNGIHPFTYLWSTGSTDEVADSLCAGNYWVTISDAWGCTDSAVFQLTGPSELIATIGGISSFCPGNCDTAEVMVTGGTTPYTYQWSTGSTNSTEIICNDSSITFNVYDAHGCSDADTIQAVVFQIPQMSLGSDTGICDGMILTLDAGNGFSTYLWNDSSTLSSISITSPGNYAVLATDSNGCSTSDSILVAVFTLPVVSLGSDTTMCTGGALVLNAGSGFSSYLWNDNTTLSMLTVTISGDYYVSVIDSNECSGSDSIQVTVNALPVVDLGSDTSICNNETILLDAGNGFTGYLWNDSSMNQSLLAFTFSMGVDTNNYFVQVTDTNGCINSDTIQVVFEICSGTLNFIPKNSITIYPNPATDQFTIEGKQFASGQIEIFNSLGEKIYSIVYSEPIAVNCELFPRGIYFVRISNSEKQLTQKLIVE